MEQHPVANEADYVANGAESIVIIDVFTPKHPNIVLNEDVFRDPNIATIDVFAPRNCNIVIKDVLYHTPAL
jgi:hypothetical protein